MRPGLHRDLVTGFSLAILAAAASAALMGLAGWLIVRSAQTGLGHVHVLLDLPQRGG